MIITRTPLRISFFGGGTDLPAYYREHGGAVLSTTIDKYAHVIVQPRFDDKIRVGYSKTELVESVDDIQHDLIREALRLTQTKSGVEINTMADIPSTGSGLGSSSAVTVGALHALYAYYGTLPNAYNMAHEACFIEIDILKNPIGKQDQYACVYGGLNLIEFHTDERVHVQRINISDDTRRALDDSLLLFHTGIGRDAGVILKDQNKHIAAHLDEYQELKELAMKGLLFLKKGDLLAFACLMDNSWHIKKRLSTHITNPDIDAMYAAARNAGALGGKLCGAGGGGFLLLYVPHERQEAVRAALHLRELPFKLDPKGSRVIFSTP